MGFDKLEEILYQAHSEGIYTKVMEKSSELTKQYYTVGDKGKTFSSLMEDIYTNSKNKEEQITELIMQLQPMIKNFGDATIIVPLIKEYLDVAVKNDEQLIKLASIVQRGILAAKTSGDASGVLLTEAEKKELLSTIQDMNLSD
jgi:hypothetical protein